MQLDEWQDQFGRAVEDLKHLTSMNRAGGNEWNSLSWDELFLDSLPGDALANAQKAAALSQNSDTDILHTLAAVLTLSRRSAEACSLMLQILEMRGLEEPDGSIWLLYGLIAESYGEKDVAAAAYRKLEAKSASDRNPTSSYQLAQRRLRLLAEANSSPPSASK